MHLSEADLTRFRCQSISFIHFWVCRLEAESKSFSHDSNSIDGINKYLSVCPQQITRNNLNNGKPSLLIENTSFFLSQQECQGHFALSVFSPKPAIGILAFRSEISITENPRTLVLMFRLSDSVPLVFTRQKLPHSLQAHQCPQNHWDYTYKEEPNVQLSLLRSEHRMRVPPVCDRMLTVMPTLI